MTSDEWTWQFSRQAHREFESLDPHVQERITSKLDAIVTDEWRDPTDYIEPLTGAPHGKVRVGAYRLGVDADRDLKTVTVYTIEHRSGAYTPGDD